MNIPAPSTDNASFAPFLKASDISVKGKTKMQILGNVREGNSAFGEGVNVDVKVGSKEFTLTVKFNSGNHRRLYDRFGKNPKRWRGVVQVQRGEYLGKQYVQICD